MKRPKKSVSSKPQGARQEKRKQAAEKINVYSRDIFSFARAIVRREAIPIEAAIDRAVETLCKQHPQESNLIRSGCSNVKHMLSNWVVSLLRKKVLSTDPETLFGGARGSEEAGKGDTGGAGGNSSDKAGAQDEGETKEWPAPKNEEQGPVQESAGS